jgi:hypothetical protein
MGSVQLILPEAPGILEAAGRVALAHGQLELMLRMTIKTLARVTVKEALDATARTKAWELRAEIMSLFKAKTKDPELRVKLKAILGKCEALSDERNRLLHNAWAIAEDGSVVAKGPNHAWGEAATPDSLNKLAADIREQVEILNKARLHGFVHDVVTPHEEEELASG